MRRPNTISIAAGYTRSFSYRSASLPRSSRTRRHHKPQDAKLTAFGADDRQPVWAPGEDALFYLSERDGTFNVWQLALVAGAQPVQITHFDTHPVRFLSISRHGDLCYTWDGEIYVQPAGAVAGHKLEVRVAIDSRHNEVEYIDVARGIPDFDLSPDGKEIAFVSRGEVFVTSAKHGTTRRITNTPEQERSVSFSPDGRSLLYASERGGSWNLYRTDLTDDKEPSFFNATAFSEKPVLVTEAVGRDQQIEQAVEVLLAEIASRTRR